MDAVTTSTTDPRSTPLRAEHEALGATFTDFGGWWMPVRYSSDRAEHTAVREAAGLFDISHMGEIVVTGRQAGEFLDFALAGRLSAVTIGRAKYTMLLAEDGGILDDLVVYRLGEEEFLVIANAANRETVAAHLQERAGAFEVSVTDDSDTYALLALQGPAAVAILEDVITTGAIRDLGLPLAEVKNYAWTSAYFLPGEDVGTAGHRNDLVLTATEGEAEDAPEVSGPLSPAPLVVGEPESAHGTLTEGAHQGTAGARTGGQPATGEAGAGTTGGGSEFETTPLLLARTGYTGEDGFELYVPAEHAAALWRLLLSAGEPHGLVPAGLAARDTLRLEAGMPLYGHELSTDVVPAQAGLGRIVPADKGDFVGKAALEPRPEARVLVGLVSEGRRAGRAGYAVRRGEHAVGEITSGALSPTLGHPIALAYVDSDVAADPDAALTIDVRGTPVPATLTTPPFYRRKS
ncbi:glycine cleavage system protein T [Ruania suaedae]|uniref:glycine cleavage system aminomethyltransferase GcvT n=1 Tax=Ruania suaedae TaxID=2897774 RepID=UPI001E49141D|nr:glycine cleavage system aminomethyltransferase GcvT [Ruania suaedae]UFU03220.1 glycine cleavage system protein T [Ruania suaedae]